MCLQPSQFSKPVTVLTLFFPLQFKTSLKKGYGGCVWLQLAPGTLSPIARGTAQHKAPRLQRIIGVKCVQYGTSLVMPHTCKHRVLKLHFALLCFPRNPRSSYQNDFVAISLNYSNMDSTGPIKTYFRISSSIVFTPFYISGEVALYFIKLPLRVAVALLAVIKYF